MQKKWSVFSRIVFLICGDATGTATLMDAACCCRATSIATNMDAPVALPLQLFRLRAPWRAVCQRQFGCENTPCFCVPPGLVKTFQ